MFFHVNSQFKRAILQCIVVGLVLWLDVVAAKSNNELPKTAIEAYNQGVYNFQLAQGQGERGNFSGQNDLLKLSLTLFRRAEALNPNMAEAFSNEAFAYLTLKEYKKAITAFNKALALNSYHLNSLNGLATAQVLAGQNTAALDTSKTLTILAPGEAQFWFNQGAICQQLKKVAEAEQAYRQALKMDPDHQRSWFNLATLYENQHRFDAAAEAYTETKNRGVSSSIGLEALHRLEAIKKAETTAPGPQT